MPIVGVGNPAPGAGQNLQYMGGNLWGGWSGSVSATDGANANLFSFRSTNIPLVATLSVVINKTNLSAAEDIGYLVTMDGITIIEYKTEVDSRFNFLDTDPIIFVIPGNSLITIEGITTDANAVAMTAVIMATQAGD